METCNNCQKDAQALFEVSSVENVQNYLEAIKNGYGCQAQCLPMIQVMGIETGRDECSQAWHKLGTKR